MEVFNRIFGTTTDGKEVRLHSMWNGRVQLDVIDYGARIIRMCAPDMDGSITDVTIGYDGIGDYADDDSGLGGVVGISGGSNTDILRICDDVVWNTVSADEEGVVFRTTVPEEVLPGKVSVTVRYSITDGNGILVEYDAFSEDETVLQLSNRLYLNLDGPDSCSLTEHMARVGSEELDLDIPSCGSTFLIEGDGLHTVAYLESKMSGISMDILSEGSTVMVDTSDPHGKKGRCGIEYTPGSAVGIVILNEPVPDADGHVHSMTEYRFRDTYPDIVW